MGGRTFDTWLERESVRYEEVLTRMGLVKQCPC